MVVAIDPIQDEQLANLQSALTGKSHHGMELDGAVKLLGNKPRSHYQPLWDSPLL